MGVYGYRVTATSSLRIVETIALDRGSRSAPLALRLLGGWFAFRRVW